MYTITFGTKVQRKENSGTKKCQDFGKFDE